jgi:hypothetical protein
MAFPVMPHPSSTTLPKILKQDASVTIPPQFAHKQLLPTIAPKMKLQTSESILVNEALFRNSDDIIEKLTSKLFEYNYIQERDSNKVMLASWARLSPSGTSALKSENTIDRSTHTSTPNFLPSSASSHALYSIREGASY